MTDTTVHPCKFCGKSWTKPNAARSHQRLCKENPDRISSPFQNLVVQQKEVKSVHQS